MTRPPVPALPRDAAIKQAQSLFLRRAFAESEALARQVLGRNRRDADALHLLAMIAIERNDAAEAIKHLDRALKLLPDDPNLRTKRATVRLMQARPDDAFREYDRALKADRAFVPAVWGKANLLARTGEPGKALDLIRPHMDEGRGNPEIVTLAVELVGKAGDLEEAVALADAHRGNESLHPLVRRNLLFALGKAYDRAGRIDEAFECFTAGNALLAIEYDRDAHRARVDALMRVFSRDALRDLPRATRTSERPIFVVGMPRCGSTLVEQILAAHPRVAGAGELPDLPRLTRELPARVGSTRAYPECTDRFTSDAADRVAAEYLAALKAADRHAPRVVDKMLLNHRHVGLISLLFPDAGAKVLHVARDPVDTGLSCYLNLSPKEQPWAADVSDVGFVHSECDRLVAHWREVLPETIRTIDYARLVREPEPVVREMLDFLGLEFDERCLRHHEHAGPIMTHSYDQAGRPITDASLGRHARYGTHLDPLRAALRGE